MSYYHSFNMLLIRSAAGLQLLPCRHSSLNSWSKLLQLCINLRVTQTGHTLIMLLCKSCSFQRVFSTNCCPFFCTHILINIIFYFNALNIFHLYIFLVQITAFGFSCLACSRAESILYALPIISSSIKLYTYVIH